MRQSLKIALSLLISLVLFSAFAVLSYWRLFREVETSFLRPRVLGEQERRLTGAAERIEKFHRDNLARFEPFLQEDYVRGALQEQQDPDSIARREAVFGRLLEDYPGLQVVRVVQVVQGAGSDGRTTRIHFSTLDSDYTTEKGRRTYLDLEQVDGPLASRILSALPEAASSAADGPRLVLDGGERQQMVYLLPIRESAGGSAPGWLLLYLSRSSLLNELIAVPALGVESIVFVADPPTQGILVDPVVAGPDALRRAVLEQWRGWAGRTGVQVGMVALQRDGEAGQGQASATLRLFHHALEQGEPFRGAATFVALALREDTAVLQPGLRVLLLAGFFLTIFLIVFLLSNLRQDPIVVIPERIKRFQLQILQESIAGKDTVDLVLWRRRLSDSREELRASIKRGAGRLKGKDEERVDQLIDRSWDEIISILEARLATREGGKGMPSDLRRLDDLPDGLRRIEDLLRSLTQGKIALPDGPAPTGPPRPIQSPAPIDVEEIGAEEVRDFSSEPGEPGTAAAGEPSGSDEPVGAGASAEAGDRSEDADDVLEVEELEDIEEPDGLARTGLIRRTAGFPGDIDFPRSGGRQVTGAPSEDSATGEGGEDLLAVEELEEVGGAGGAGDFSEIRVPSQHRARLDGSGFFGGGEDPEDVEELEEIGEPETGADADEPAQRMGESEPQGLERLAEPAEEAALAGADGAEGPEELEELESVGPEEADAETKAGNGGRVAAAPVAGPAAEGIPPSPDDPIEELEVVPEIIPLPPEPQEDLELLPLADDEADMTQMTADGWASASPPGAAAQAETAVREEIGELEELKAVGGEEGELGDTELVGLLGETMEDLEIGELPAAGVEDRGQPGTAADPPGGAGSATGGQPTPHEEGEFARLLREERIHLYTLEQLQSAVEEQRSSVVMEDGVYRIREELYQDHREPPAVRAEPSPSEKKSGEAASSGIGELFGLDGGLDLQEALGGRPAGGEPDGSGQVAPSLRGRVRSKRLYLGPHGLDLDAFLVQFGASPSYAAQMKALADVSGSVQAVSAAILRQAGPAYTPELTIGLMDSSIRSLRFQENEPFYREFLGAPHALLINYEIGRIRAVCRKLNPEDLRYMSGALFLPVLFQSQPAILFMAFSEAQTWNIKELIIRMNIF